MRVRCGSGAGQVRVRCGSGEGSGNRLLLSKLLTSVKDNLKIDRPQFYYLSLKEGHLYFLKTVKHVSVTRLNNEKMG